MFSPAEVAANYLNTGKSKASLPIWKMLLLGFLAGMFIALAGAGFIFGTAYVNKVVGAIIFPGGLSMVLVAGSELFTGNCLLIMPVLTKDIKITGMLKNWLFVYIGNLIGAMFIAFLCAKCGAFDADPVLTTASGVALGKVSMSFLSAFFKGILCNILVCIAVWMSFAAKTVWGKIASTIFPVWIFVLCGFEHSIADMFYVPLGLFMGADGVTWGGFFVSNLLPVTLGNIVGGCLVGVCYWLCYLLKKKNQ